MYDRKNNREIIMRLRAKQYCFYIILKLNKINFFFNTDDDFTILYYT